MNIEQLQYICMVAKTNSMTVAASNLYVTQQTISKAIGKLEQELGTTLMTRSHKGIQLTETGEVFVEKANHIVQAFRELYDSTYVNRENQHISGTVQIYWTNYVEQLVGTKFMTTMREKYPDLHVKVTTLLSAESIERFKNVKDQIAISHTLNGECGAGKIDDYSDIIDKEFLLRDTLVACLAESNPLSQGKSVSLKEISKYPATWGECVNLNDIFIKSYNIGFNIVLESSNTALLQDAILNGNAFSFATELIIHDKNYNTNGLKIMPIKESLKLETYLVKAKGYELNKQQQVVVDELKNILKRI